MKIKTHFNPPPIPLRQFDWSAVDDDAYDGGDPIGFGVTQQAAINDLREQLTEAGESHGRVP